MDLSPEQLAAIAAEVAKALAPQVAAAPAASPAPWITEAKAASKAKAAKAAAPKVAATYVVQRSSFTPPKGGAVIHGYAVVKMFGDKPSSFRPNGKFVTVAEYEAIRNHKS